MTMGPLPHSQASNSHRSGSLGLPFAVKHLSTPLVFLHLHNCFLVTSGLIPLWSTTLCSSLFTVPALTSAFVIWRGSAVLTASFAGPRKAPPRGQASLPWCDLYVSGSHGMWRSMSTWREGHCAVILWREYTWVMCCCATAKIKHGVKDYERLS